MQTQLAVLSRMLYGPDYSIESWRAMDRSGDPPVAPMRWVKRKQRQERAENERACASDKPKLLKQARRVWNPFPKWFYQSKFKREPGWLWKARWRWHDRVLAGLRVLDRERKTRACVFCKGGFIDAGSLGKLPCDRCEGNNGRICCECLGRGGAGQGLPDHPCRLCGMLGIGWR